MQPATPRGRNTTGAHLRGVDAARAVAIAGMVTVHFGPYPVPDTLAGAFYGLPAGRASVLFALLAGIGVSLMAASHPRDRPAEAPTGGLAGPIRARLRGRLALRGALLLPLGLWLQRLDHGALVILQYYAVYFLLAALVVGISGRWLLAEASAALVLGPVVYLSGEALAPDVYAATPATLGDPISKLLPDLLLSGAYPLVTWAAPLLFGIWLGRKDLGSATVRRRLLAAGCATTAVAALSSWLALSAFGEVAVGSAAGASLLAAEPHGQTTLWMAGSIGSACAVLGAGLMLAGAPGRAPRLTWPLVAMGQMALSVYAGHLLLLHYAGGLLNHEEVIPASLAVAAFLALAGATCTAWRTAFRRGPLEKALTLPWEAVERALDLERQRSVREP